MNAPFVQLFRLLAAGPSAYGLSWEGLGLTVGLALIAVFSCKELVRAYGGDRVGTWMRAFNLAIVPLLVVFGVSVLERILALVIS